MPKHKNKAAKPFSKNVGPFLAFSPEWFNQHQKILLWFLNTRGVRIWARWILRIHKDVPIKMKIAEIGHNFFIFDRRLVKIEGKWRIQQTADFRTHPKFAKRMYYAFRPIWWVIHFWDWILADRFIPQWSYGFLTLTAFPDASSGGTTVDGYLLRTAVNETLATIRVGAGNQTQKTLTNIDIQLQASATTNQYQQLNRGIATFDTSGLTAGATINSAIIGVAALGNNFYDLGNADFHIGGSTPASNNNLVNADYNQCQTTSFGNIVQASWVDTVGTYNNVTLNASGLANISKTAISKFSYQLSWDINNSFGGTWRSNFGTLFSFSSADTTGTSSDDKLVVTYTTSTAWTSTLTETVSFTDTVIKTVTRTLTETLTLSNVLAAIRVYATTLTEAIGLSDTFFKTVTRTLTETLTLADVFIKTLTRTLTETFAILDFITTTVTKFIGHVFMRSNQNVYPKGMDKNDTGTMRSNQQSSPKSMDDSSIK